MGYNKTTVIITRTSYHILLPFATNRARKSVKNRSCWKKKSEKDKCVTEKLKISVDATEIDTVSEKLTLPATVLDETAEKANRLVELLREATQSNDSLSDSQSDVYIKMSKEQKDLEQILLQRIKQIEKSTACKEPQFSQTALELWKVAGKSR